MKKEKVKNIISTLIYLFLGISSFIAAGFFLNTTIINSDNNHIFRACLFCGMGLFWIFRFGEKRKESVFEEDENDLFFGSKIEDDSEN